jgi:sulfate adenylyltransferase
MGPQSSSKHGRSDLFGNLATLLSGNLERGRYNEVCIFIFLHTLLAMSAQRLFALTSLLVFNFSVSFRMPAIGSMRPVLHSHSTLDRSLKMVAAPHGGKLINTMVSDHHKQRELMAGCDMEVELDERQLCDVELLMQGGFSPLDGYMDEADYKSVVNDFKLANGLIFGLPVVFDTNDENIKVGSKLLLKYAHIPIAVMTVSSKYTPNKPLEAKKCYGTSSIEHPAVLMITTGRGK